MTMLNAPTINDLKRAKLIFGPRLQSWIEQRNIDINN